MEEVADDVVMEGVDTSDPCTMNSDPESSGNNTPKENVEPEVSEAPPTPPPEKVKKKKLKKGNSTPDRVKSPKNRKRKAESIVNGSDTGCDNAEVTPPKKAGKKKESKAKPKPKPKEAISPKPNRSPRSRSKSPRAKLIQTVDNTCESEQEDEEEAPAKEVKEVNEVKELNEVKEVKDSEAINGDCSSMSDDSDDKPLVPRNVSLDQPTGLIGIPQVGRPEDLRDDDDDDDENDTGERPYQCTECSYKARKKGQLRKHMAVHNVFQCAHCEYSAKARDELQEHMKEKHPNRCGRKLCKKCNVLFLAVDLEEHEKQCTGEKKGWTCPHCQKEFKFVCVMKTHIQRWHTEEGAKRFGCKQCDFRALCQKELSAHNHAEHREVEVKPARAIKCPECDEQFDDEASVRTHVKEMHIHERPFICELCQKAFKTKTHLKNHYETHNPSDTYKCEEEGCLSTFKAAKYYERHRVEVHKLPPRRHRTVYACSQEGCSEVFQRKSHLQRHEISHTGEKKFRCEWPECGRLFGHADNLQKHYRSHTHEKPYKCELCENAYNQRSGLKYHMLKGHGLQLTSSKQKKAEEKTSISNEEEGGNMVEEESPAKEEVVEEKGRQEEAESGDTSGKDVYDFNDSEDDDIELKIRQVTPVKSPRRIEEKEPLKEVVAEKPKGKKGKKKSKNEKEEGEKEAKKGKRKVDKTEGDEVKKTKKKKEKKKSEKSEADEEVKKPKGKKKGKKAAKKGKKKKEVAKKVEEEVVESSEVVEEPPEEVDMEVDEAIKADEPEEEVFEAPPEDDPKAQEEPMPRMEEEDLPLSSPQTDKEEEEQPGEPEEPMEPLESIERAPSEREEAPQSPTPSSSNQSEANNDDRLQANFASEVYEMPGAPRPPPMPSDEEEEEEEEEADLQPPLSNPVASQSFTEDANPASTASVPAPLSSEPSERPSIDYMQTPLSEPYSVPPPSYGERRSSFGTEILSPTGKAPDSYQYPDSQASYPGSYSAQVGMPGSAEAGNKDMHNSIPSSDNNYNTETADTGFHAPPSVSQPEQTDVSYSSSLPISSESRHYAQTTATPTYMLSTPTTSTPVSTTTSFGSESFPSTRDFFGQYFQDPNTLPLSHQPQDQRALPTYQQQPSLSALQRSNADFLRRASLMPGTSYPSVTESFIGMPPTALPQPPTQPSWPGMDERSRHWTQPSPIIMPTDIDSSASRNPYPNEYASSFEQKRPESAFPASQPPSNELPYRGFNAPGNYRAPQKPFDDMYRSISDYRSLPQPMTDMYSRMGAMAAAGLDKYYYPRDMYRPQLPAAPFMPATTTPQIPPYAERDYPRNTPMYPQPTHGAYGFITDKQYMGGGGNKVPQAPMPSTPAVVPGAEYLQGAPAGAPQDPYRSSLMYNMMQRYF